MAKPNNLEDLRAIFADNRQHIAIGKITQLGLADDRSCLRVQVLIFDTRSSDDREVVAVMGWDDVGADCGSIRFPEINDMVLVAFVDGDPDQCYVIKRLTSKEEKLPLKAVDGHSVFKATAGKKVYVESNVETQLIGTALKIVKTIDDAATENLVLGQQLKTFLSTLMGYLAAHQHTCNMPGGLSSVPSGASGSAAQFTVLKASPVDDSALLSNFAFTEKG